MRRGTHVVARRHESGKREKKLKLIERAPRASACPGYVLLLCWRESIRCESVTRFGAALAPPSWSYHRVHT